MAVASTRYLSPSTSQVAVETATAEELAPRGPLLFRGIVYALLFESLIGIFLWSLYRLVSSIA